MMSKLTAAYHRMNQRERMLTLGITAVLFVLVNVFIWNWLFGSLGSAHRDLASRKSTRSEQAVYMKERGLWEKRKEWLDKTQPALKDAAEASTLLDQLKQIGGKYDLLILLFHQDGHVPQSRLGIFHLQAESRRLRPTSRRAAPPRR